MSFLLAFLLLSAQAPAPAPTSTSPVAKRLVYESVVGFKGKPIGTTIMIEVHDDNSITGWIQRNDFFPIDSGRSNPEKITFTSTGNEYDINLRTMRINYKGPDGTGNQRVEKMTRVEGRIYKLTEETDEGRSVTLQVDGNEKEFLIGRPSIWKHSAPPIDRFERPEEVLGKTTAVWLTRSGGAQYVALMEEPEGMDLQKKLPKDKDKKKKK